jgi:hypothetical protein
MPEQRAIKTDTNLKVNTGIKLAFESLLIVN